MKVTSLFGGIIVAVITLTAIATDVHSEELNKPHNTREWGQVTEGFQVSVRVKKNKVYIGEVVNVQIFTRNASKDVLYFIDEHHDFRVVVKDSQGKALPMTRLGNVAYSQYKKKYGIEKRDQDETYSRSIKKLNLGQEIQYHMDYTANAYYDMTLPGTYFIAAKRYFPVGVPPSFSVEVT
ncbi:MAG: hypothetical protein GY862_38510 [Gammaproteobacteria bacterium]|nr:hypothetical protein [Gammaproteobacteria bacterium]